VFLIDEARRCVHHEIQTALLEVIDVTASPSESESTALRVPQLHALPASAPRTLKRLVATSRPRLSTASSVEACPPSPSMRETTYRPSRSVWGSVTIGCSVRPGCSPCSARPRRPNAPQNGRTRPLARVGGEACQAPTHRG
jgi:hypothetical protein